LGRWIFIWTTADQRVVVKLIPLEITDETHDDLYYAEVNYLLMRVC